MMRGALHLLLTAECPLWQARFGTYRHLPRAPVLRAERRHERPVYPAPLVVARLDNQDPDAAPLQIIRRFLAAHGPATRDDCGRWRGMIAAHGQEAEAASLSR